MKILISTPDEIPPLLKGHISIAKGGGLTRVFQSFFNLLAKHIIFTPFILGHGQVLAKIILERFDWVGRAFLFTLALWP